MSLLKDLLAQAAETQVSDIHVKAGQKPIFRLNGRLVESDFEPLDPEGIQRVVEDILPSHLVQRYEAEHEADFSHEEDGAGRFRVNVFMSQGTPTLAMRHVKTKIPSFEDLNLPAQLKKLALVPRGILLLSGTTGCGKSSTLAAIIQHINANDKRRIITIEDPIEYQFEDEQSVISQREVNLDTLNFHAALKHVMRQDPDVIMIGEMRDYTSFMAALAAAETGHLVLSTLHSGAASQAINRILDFFPSNEQNQIRMAIAGNLHAVVCQRLIPSTRGSRVPAVEIMINTSTVRKLLEKNQLETLYAAIETGKEDGMQTFDQAIYDLIKGGKITEAEGMRFATNQESLRMNLKGIFLDEGRRILAT